MDFEEWYEASGKIVEESEFLNSKNLEFLESLNSEISDSQIPEILDPGFVDFSPFAPQNQPQNR